MKAFLLAGAVALAPIGLQAAQAAVTIEPARTTGLLDQGRSSARQIDLAIVLAHRNEAELERVVAELGDRQSPLYKKFLTSEQFRERFSPTEADFQRVASALVRAGFTITSLPRNRLVISARAPAPVAAAYFNTEIHEFTGRSTGRYGNITPAVVPAEIADVVAGVAGLTDISGFHTDIAFGTHQKRASDAPSGPYVGPDGGTGPAVFETAYQLPILNGFDGTGRTAAILIDADFLDSDIAMFLTYFGITQTGAITRVPVDGGPPAGLSGGIGYGDSDEAELDVETISSLAPGANVLVYEGVDFSNTAHFVDAYNAVLNDNKADSVNASFGYCERFFLGLGKMVDSLATEGAALGITFHASSGDQGSVAEYGCDIKSVNVPAASPHVLALGGTAILFGPETGAFLAEAGWTGSPYAGDDSSGGGVSAVFKLPSYQSNVPNIVKGGRNVPDISFDADPQTGVSYVYGGSFAGPVGGTSLASPIFGAALVELNEMAGTRAGLVNSNIYGAWLANGYGKGASQSFRDITMGSNGKSNGDYKVKKGYDQVTGIGVGLMLPLAGALK